MDQAQRPVYKRWWFWLACAVFFITIVSAASGDPSTTQTTAPAEKLVDAPHLLSLTIEDARKELGTPIDGEFTEPKAEQLALGGTKIWDNSFEIGEHLIILDFDVKTREVTSFFIDAIDSEKGTEDWKALLAITNLSEASDDYQINPVEALKYPGYYTGVIAKE